MYTTMATKSPYLLSKFSNSSQLNLEKLLVSSDRDLAFTSKTIEVDSREEEAAMTTKVDHVIAEVVEEVMAMVVNTTTETKT